MIVEKDYLGFEAQRNRTHAQMYTEILQVAFGTDNDVLVGHHICFEHDHKIETENEIPSADTLIFDHDIMKRAFGSMSRIVIRECADVPVEERDAKLLEFWTREKVRREGKEVIYAGLTLHDM